MQITIDPCPFCGSEYAGIGIDANHEFIFCDECESRGPGIKLRPPITHREQEAIDKWNTRHKPKDQDEEA